MMSFEMAVKTCLKKSFTISGRATRAEYWWFQLFSYSVAILAGISFETADESGSVFLNVVGGICIAAWMLSIIPSFCARIRRLHDAGKPGEFIFWGLIPYVGSLIVLVAELKSSDKDNEYGPSPDTIISKESDCSISQSEANDVDSSNNKNDDKKD